MKMSDEKSIFPIPGVWIVDYSGRRSRILRLSNLPKNPWPRIELAFYRDVIAEIIAKTRNKRKLNSWDISDRIIRTISEIRENS